MLDDVLFMLYEHKNSREQCGNTGRSLTINKPVLGGLIMAAKLLMLPGKTVKKSNALARARWSPDSVWEPRLVAMLAAQIKSGDTDFQTYEIRLVDVLGKDPGGKDYQEFEKVIDKVMSRVITLRNGDDWKKYTMFSSCEYISKKGILKIGFHPDLKEHYLQLNQYIKYNLIEFMLLPSIYSQRLFEFLKSWDDRKEKIIELKELHEMLDTPKALRAKYKDFRVRVLDKAHKDILRFTDLYYTWEPVKKGRAVSWIKFIFGKKPKIIKNASAGLPTNSEQNKPGAYLSYEKFLQKFPNPAANRFTAYKTWNELQDMGIAPKAEDVPENNQLGIMEFLEQWQASHAQASK